MAKIQFLRSLTKPNILTMFLCVSPDIYNLYIGGYQVCNKWLKDRKGREFTDDDFDHYSQIVAILKRTQEIMDSIDQVIENFDGFPIT